MRAAVSVSNEQNSSLTTNLYDVPVVTMCKRKDIFHSKACFVVKATVRFANLTKKKRWQMIVERIQQIEREQLRRKSSKLANYNKDKVHAKQMAFHQCQKRNRWVFGGNRSGKTECGAVETVWLARGIHPFRANKDDIDCWVVSVSRDVQKQVAQKKVLQYLDKNWIDKVVMISGSKDSPQYGVIDFIVVKNVFGGKSKIGFKSCESGRDKFQGASLDFVWFDEEPPYEIYQECRMRVVDRQGHLFGTMTPLKGLTWVYDEIYLNCHNSDQVWCEFMEWADNPYLSADEITALSQSMSQDMLDSRRYGRFAACCGLVYPEFDVNLHVIQPFFPPMEWQDKLSIDPGLNNPLSCHWYCKDFDGNVYVVAEHYEAKRDVKYHAARIKEICQRLDWHTDKFGCVETLMDSAANQRTLSGQRSVCQLFAEEGLAVNTRVNKDVYTGINKVKAMLQPVDGKPRLYVFSSCVNLIREIKGYFWGNDDAPVKRDDHAMDELRYYVCSLEDKPVRQSLTAVQRDKQRLAKQLGRL